MKTKTLIFTMVCVMVALSSCVLSDGKLKPVTPESKFNAISVFNNIEVIMTPGNKVSYQVSGKESAKSKLKIGIEGDELMVKADGLKGTDKLSISLTAPMPKSICTFNNASFVLNGSVDIDDLELKSWNSSEIVIDKNIIAKKVSALSFNNGHIVIKSIIADKLRIKAVNNSAISVSGKVKWLSKSVLNGATVDINGLSDTHPKQISNDCSEDKIIVYSEDINLIGSIFD